MKTRYGFKNHCGLVYLSARLFFFALPSFLLHIFIQRIPIIASKLRVLCISMGLVVYSNGVTAQDQTSMPDNIQGRSHLRVALFGFEPWVQEPADISIKNSDSVSRHQYSGALPDMIRLISKELNEPIEMVYVNYPRMLRMLENGSIDFSIFFESSASLSVSSTLLNIAKFKTVVISPISSAPGLLKSLDYAYIASPRSVYYEPTFDGNKLINRIYTLDYTHAVNLLKRDRIDAVVGPLRFLKYSFLKNGITPSDYQIVSELTMNKASIQFSNMSPLTNKKTAIRQIGERLKSSGEFLRILNYYFPQNSTNFKPLIFDNNKPNFPRKNRYQ